MNDTLKALVEAADKTPAAPWFTVDAIWLPGPDIPTYVIAGNSDPHVGKPVVDAFLKEEFEEDESEEDAVSEAYAIMEFCALARNSIDAIRASLARDAALEKYIAELRADRGATEGYDDCADRLEQIMKGGK